MTCWWWYETAVSEGEPSSSCQSVLPAGEIFTVEQVPRKAPDRILCRLDNEEGLRSVMVPEKNRVQSFELCKPTPFRVELSKAQITESCERHVDAPKV